MQLIFAWFYWVLFCWVWSLKSCWHSMQNPERHHWGMWHNVFRSSSLSFLIMHFLSDINLLITIDKHQIPANVMTPPSPTAVLPCLGGGTQLLPKPVLWSSCVVASIFDDEWGGVSDILVLMELNVGSIALTSTALALSVATNRDV